MFSPPKGITAVCFNIPSTTSPVEGGSNTNLLEEQFINFAAKYGIVGIKGYRTVGGFRASIYNAMPESGIDILIEAMREFEKSHA